jgi:ribosome-associated translation inhibitor RaiA
MRSDIIFKDIQRSEYIENFVNEKIDALAEKIQQFDSDLHLCVRLQEDRQGTPMRHPIFHCEVSFKAGINENPYVVSRQDRNLFRAIVACFDALKVILGKTHERLHHDRRRHRSPSSIPST